ncbi:MAG: InlB B-repeat-containing protein [Peptococcaceae bacterium]|nr:InlB B-repeat-containing protein [Peptococcaceae bacterium]
MKKKNRRFVFIFAVALVLGLPAPHWVMDAFAANPSEPPVTYTVSYNMNLGTPAIPPQTKIQGVGLTLDSTSPDRSNMIFIGWAAPGGLTYQPGDVFTVDANTTLQAIWHSKIIFDANGGIDAPDYITRPYTYEPTQLPAEEPTHAFLGWAKDSEATEPDYLANGYYTELIARHITLYAVWQPNVAYTVSYNMNLGTPAIPPQTKIQGVGLTLDSTSPDRSNMIFMGWAAPGGLTYQPGDVFTVDANTTLQAIWHSKIIFDANGGVDAPDYITRPYTYEPTQLPAEEPTRFGHAFLGWAKDSEATEPDYLANGTFAELIARHITLYAVWQPNVTYTVTYNTDWGTPAIPSQTKIHGVDLKLDSTPLTRAGMVFVWWEGDDGETYAPGAIFTTDANTDLRAVWYLEIIFDANGGYGGPDKTLRPYTYESTALPLEEPTRTGYIFQGWAEDPEADSPKYPAGGYITKLISPSAVVTSGKFTLYAVWKNKDDIVNINDIKLGMFYYGGWNETGPSKWPAIKTHNIAHPEDFRQPWLGYYDDSNKEVLEQQMSVMSDYGIDFATFAWYWNAGTRAPNRYVDAYLQASNKSLLDYSLLWCNDNVSPNSFQDWQNIVGDWISHDLGKPEYLRIEGRPVVFIWSMGGLKEQAESFGSTPAELLDWARMATEAEGLGPIYFVLCLPDNTPVTAVPLAEEAGFDALTAYYCHLGLYYYEKEQRFRLTRYSHNYAEYDGNLRTHWQYVLQHSELPYFIPMNAGWDSRPWQQWKPSEDPLHDNCQPTADELERHLRAGYNAIVSNKDKTMGIGMLSSWNEYGEGTIFEPTIKNDFDFVKRIRKVFRSGE